MDKSNNSDLWAMKSSVPDVSYVSIQDGSSYVASSNSNVEDGCKTSNDDYLPQLYFSHPLSQIPEPPVQDFRPAVNGDPMDYQRRTNKFTETAGFIPSSNFYSNDSPDSLDFIPHRQMNSPKVTPDNSSDHLISFAQRNGRNSNGLPRSSLDNAQRSSFGKPSQFPLRNSRGDLLSTQRNANVILNGSQLPNNYHVNGQDESLFDRSSGNLRKNSRDTTPQRSDGSHDASQLHNQSKSFSKIDLVVSNLLTLIAPMFTNLQTEVMSAIAAQRDNLQKDQREIVKSELKDIKQEIQQALGDKMTSLRGDVREMIDLVREQMRENNVLREDVKLLRKQMSQPKKECDKPKEEHQLVAAAAVNKPITDVHLTRELEDYLSSDSEDCDAFEPVKQEKPMWQRNGAVAGRSDQLPLNQPMLNGQRVFEPPEQRHCNGCHPPRIEAEHCAGRHDPHIEAELCEGRHAPRIEAEHCDGHHAPRTEAERCDEARAAVVRARKATQRVNKQQTRGTDRQLDYWPERASPHAAGRPGGGTAYGRVQQLRGEAGPKPSPPQQRPYRSEESQLASRFIQKHLDPEAYRAYREEFRQVQHPNHRDVINVSFSQLEVSRVAGQKSPSQPPLADPTCRCCFRHERQVDGFAREDIESDDDEPGVVDVPCPRSQRMFDLSRILALPKLE